MTRLWVGQPRIQIPIGVRGFSLLQECPILPCGSPSVLVSGYLGIFYGGEMARA